VQELVSEKLVKTMKGLAGEIDFALKESVIELRGVCSSCKEH